VTVQTTRLSVALTSTDASTVKLKVCRKLLRAWELSNNLSNPLKLKASLKKYVETAVFSTKPLIINLLVKIITICHELNQ
jgi:hypothetical protein